MPKFETIPYISDGRVTEVEVTLNLSEEELEQARRLQGEEYQKFIKERAHVRISDFDIDWEAPPIEDWDTEDDLLSIETCTICGEKFIEPFLEDGVCLCCIDSEE